LLSYAQSFQQFQSILYIYCMTKHVTSINPYNNQVLSNYTLHSNSELNQLLSVSNEAYLKWRFISINERIPLIQNVARVLEENKHRYAHTITQEMGKPISQALAEIEKCKWLCEYYATNAVKHLSKQLIETDAYKSYVTYEPLGVILAIMPWNYPFWQVFRFAIPNLLLGNVGVLKHASNVFGCAKHIEDCIREAGFLKGCFTTLFASKHQVDAIIENPVVKGITLTGSGPAGTAVASKAGEHIKKTVLELGGNNALIVCKDCNIDATIATCIQARFQNTGQSCIAGKRLLIDVEIKEDFLSKLVNKVSLLKSGDPLQSETFIGPMVHEKSAQELEDLLDRSKAMGAQVLIGGNREGAYFQPTLVDNVHPDMPIFKEETFGPLLTITSFSTIEEAIQLSNNSKFGLGVSIFTSNIEKAENLISQFEEGAVFINELVKSDPRLPFGGIKESGYGRELSIDGLHEFANKKTVYIKKEP